MCVYVWVQSVGFSQLCELNAPWRRLRSSPWWWSLCVVVKNISCIIYKHCAVMSPVYHSQSKWSIKKTQGDRLPFLFWGLLFLGHINSGGLRRCPSLQRRERVRRVLNALLCSWCIQQFPTQVTLRIFLLSLLEEKHEGGVFVFPKVCWGWIWGWILPCPFFLLNLWILDSAAFPPGCVSLSLSVIWGSHLRSLHWTSLECVISRS